MFHFQELINEVTQSKIKLKACNLLSKKIARKFFGVFARKSFLLLAIESKCFGSHHKTDNKQTCPRNAFTKTLCSVPGVEMRGLGERKQLRNADTDEVGSLCISLYKIFNRNVFSFSNEQFKQLFTVFKKLFKTLLQKMHYSNPIKFEFKSELYKKIRNQMFSIRSINVEPLEKWVPIVFFTAATC